MLRLGAIFRKVEGPRRQLCHLGLELKLVLLPWEDADSDYTGPGHEFLKASDTYEGRFYIQYKPQTFASVSKLVNAEYTRTSTGKTNASDSSKASLVDQHGGPVNIYKCPGGKAACPGGPVCADGHKGPACALCWTCADDCRERSAKAGSACKASWAQDASRRCIRCEASTDNFPALFAAASVIPLMVVLYVFSARPMRKALTDNTNKRQSCHWIGKTAFFQTMSGMMNRMLSSAATKYLAWTVSDDPYAAKAFARPQSVLDTIKVLVSYLQVDGHTSFICCMR